MLLINTVCLFQNLYLQVNVLSLASVCSIKPSICVDLKNALPMPHTNVEDSYMFFEMNNFCNLLFLMLLFLKFMWKGDYDV